MRHTCALTSSISALSRELVVMPHPYVGVDVCVYRNMDTVNIHVSALSRELVVMPHPYVCVHVCVYRNMDTVIMQVSALPRELFMLCITNMRSCTVYSAISYQPTWP